MKKTQIKRYKDYHDSIIQVMNLIERKKKRIEELKEGESRLDLEFDSYNKERLKILQIIIDEKISFLGKDVSQSLIELYEDTNIDRDKLLHIWNYLDNERKKLKKLIDNPDEIKESKKTSFKLKSIYYNTLLITTFLFFGVFSNYTLISELSTKFEKSYDFEIIESKDYISSKRGFCSDVTYLNEEGKKKTITYKKNIDYVYSKEFIRLDVYSDVFNQRFYKIPGEGNVEYRGQNVGKIVGIIFDLILVFFIVNLVRNKIKKNRFLGDFFEDFNKSEILELKVSFIISLIILIFGCYLFL